MTYLYVGSVTSSDWFKKLMWIGNYTTVNAQLYLQDKMQYLDV